MNKLLDIFSIRVPINKNRILILDFIRGMLVFSVLYHHAGSPFGPYVLQFHMPALFILSGYTESILNKNTSFFKYVKSRFFRLVVPYFFFEIANLILYVLINLFIKTMDFSFTLAIKDITTCLNSSYTGLYGRLWFLPAMFVCSVFSYIIKAILCKNKHFIIALFIPVMLIFSYISSYIIPFRLPFTIDIAFLGTAFFLLGHICQGAITYICESKNHPLNLLLLIFFSALFILCNKIANPICYMYIN